MPANDHYWWNQRSLHITFAGSCVALLVGVIWMMAQDQNDEWRHYQRTNFRLDAAMKASELEAMRTEEFEKQQQVLQESVRESKKSVDAKLAEQQELVDEHEALSRDLDDLRVRLKAQNGIRDEAVAIYGLGVRDGLSEEVLAERDAAAKLEQEKADELALEIEQKNTLFSELDAQLVAISEELAGAEKALADFTADYDRLADSLDVVAPGGMMKSLKRSVMEWPIIDGFNSHLKPVQDWIPTLHQTLGMTQIARFDRCRSCHLNIDKTLAGGIAAFPAGHPEGDTVDDWVAAGEFPQPFSTHPNTDLYCSASSPHPVATFGCTVCHDGQGSGTSFGNAEHTPNDPVQDADWHHEYGYHPNHFWEYPMHPDRFIESGCIKCHHDVTELGVNPTYGASAPKVYEGFQLIQKYGCFGCHEIYGNDGGSPIGPDMRLEPQTAEQSARIESDPNAIAGKYRKVGPSLRHIADKAGESWVSHWTEDPQGYRPSTKMPKFFHLTNQQDEQAEKFQPVEIAGLAALLIDNSEDFDYLSPSDGYVADVERGKQLFAERGCLACHEHSAVEAPAADFGPNISDIHLKVKRDAENPEFSSWLYTWLRDPERYHKRTRMPNLYLTEYQDADGATVDPAADITAFLLSQGNPGDFTREPVSDAALDELVLMYLKKARLTEEKAAAVLEERRFPRPADKVGGDEIALATEDGSAFDDPGDWRRAKLNYIGRRTITKYGCYGCHDIAGYEDARPIGVALQDWGRKDTSKLGFEHIAEWLHHHGEPDGSSTFERVEDAVAREEAGGVEAGQFGSAEERDTDLAAAFFYESLEHHGRPGFIWQKLRQPRSYDYEKIEHKGYDDRLKMPKFPLKEDEIEAIATFVLGLVADPPAPEYIYTPDVRDEAIIEGEFLLAKYNCTGCHMTDLSKVTFGADLAELSSTELGAADYAEALPLLLKFRQPRQALTGESGTFNLYGEETELPVASFHGMRYSRPDPEEDPEYQENGFDTWETLVLGEGEDAVRILPGTRMIIPQTTLVDVEPARGGAYAEWLVERLMETKTEGNRYLAWQASPPPLYQEGVKVQTPWLYQFLLEPHQIRYTTVLRMPRFNMSPEEAQSLANYFAAVDGVEFPYQEVGPRDRDYLAETEAVLRAHGMLDAEESYLGESWDALNGPLCVKCHSVGGRKFVVSDPKKDIQGPNLNRVQERLRADWVKLWLYKPTWITPYTSMPVNFPKNNRTQFPELFDGDPGAQVIGVRDSLMNYGRLIEDIGPTVYTPPSAAPEAAASETAAGAEE